MTASRIKEGGPGRPVGLFLALMSLAVLILAVAAPGATAGSEESESAQDRRQRVIDYWTPERVRNATPRLPVLDGAPAHHRPDHAGGPGGGDDSGDDSTEVTGAPWTDDSAPGMVGETTGKVLFTMKGQDYVCSGSTVTSPEGESLVLTAGHCVHDGDNKTTSWATNWMFVPAYEDGGSFFSCDTTTYGCWTAGTLTTTTPWYESSKFDDDAGFAVMDDGGHNTSNLVDTVGSQAITFSNPVVGETIYAFGYPAAQKYSGNDLIYCAGTSIDGVQTGTAGLNCDMTGGSSGGPWYAAFAESTATGTAVSVNSHIYRSLKDVMFGPVFDEHEQAAFDLAKGTSSTSTNAKSSG